ncbi:hypothetical protein Tco_0756583 [Tanacetum coccineum]
MQDHDVTMDHGTPRQIFIVQAQRHTDVRFVMPERTGGFLLTNSADGGDDGDDEDEPSEEDEDDDVDMEADGD